MKFPNARKFFGGMRKRIYGFFGRKIGATPSKSKQPNIKQPIEHHCHLPMELECESTCAITMDLTRPRHRKLPAELNQEIFLCLKPATQRKFIWGLGWDFYAMFRYRLLTKTKRVGNPHGNHWNGAATRATSSANGLNVSYNTNTNEYTNVFAEQPFSISGPLCRMDGFPGTICYYYEVKILKSADFWWSEVGLSGGQIPQGVVFGRSPNSYTILIPPNWNFYIFCLVGERHNFELPEGVIRPELKGTGNVVGCGILINPDGKVTIFFTFNGILIGRQFPIDPTVDHLIPTVTLCDDMSLEANFGDDPAKPFEYDIKKCPGMGLEWI